MNCLVELFLNECENGICIKEGENFTIIENVNHTITYEGDLIMYDLADGNNKYIVKNFNNSKVFEFGDDLIKIHTKDKEIYIEML